jgi:two-component system NtrC family sensor kinase
VLPGNAVTEENESRLRLFRNLVNQSDDIITIVDSETGAFLDVNDTACRVLGYNHEELLTMNVTDIAGDLPDLTAWAEHVQEVRRKGFLVFEDQVRCKNGTSFLAEISVRLAPLGEREFLVAVLRDITDRKQRERAFNESERRFHDLLATVKLIAMTLDVRGNITFCNDYLLSLTGWDRSEIMGRSWFEIFIPDDLQNEMKRVFLDGIKSDSFPSHYENPIKTRQGERRLILWNNTLLRFAGGNISGSASIGEDITERRRAEEELRKSEKKYKGLFDSTLDGVYQVDAEGKFIMINTAGAGIFGYENPGDIIGRDVLKYWRNPEDRDALIKKLRLRKSVSAYPIAARTKDGNPIEVESSSRIIEDEEGNFKGIEGVLRDVTERRTLENQLRQAQKMEAVGQLAGGIAHDFNNILSVIIGYGHLLHGSMSVDDPMRVSVEQILESAESATEVTHSLLAFSRKQLMKPKPLNINDTMKRFEKLFSRLIGEDIEIRTSFTEEDVIVMADGGQIEQVLMNLATNARDAMPRGGRFALSTEIVDLDDTFVRAHGYGKPGIYAVISVSDTGVGMGKETIAKIFEPFFTTKEPGKGTGLGLAMVYGIVKQHDGYITCYSEPGQGTIFRIYLPVLKMRYETPETTHVQLLKGGTETILVAEDDEKLRKLFEIILAGNGYKVILAVDGEDAVSKFMKNGDDIQLVMLDMIMPKKNGKEAYEEIKRIRSGIKVLFASGYTADKAGGEWMQEEGVEMISKPVSPKDLLRRVREILDG